MTTFFDNLKRRRDFGPEEQADPVEPQAPASFLSSVKQRRDAPRPPIEIDEFEDRPESFSERVRRGAKDVAGQSAVGLASGALGSYGNLLSLAGINPPEGYINPGEAAQYQMESQILDKMNQPGYKPSVSDIYALSSDDDIAPRYSRLPTSGEISRGIESLGGPGEASTPEGSYARRASEIFGGGAALGATGVVAPLAGAAAGEAVQHLGGSPLLQAAAEIATMVATGGRNVNPLRSGNRAVQAEIDALKKLGYSEPEILAAVNAQKAGSSAVTRAKPTSASEKVLSGAVAKSEGLFSDTLERAFPGFEKGAEHVHNVASDAYGTVAREARNVRISNTDRLDRVIDNVTKRVRNTLGENPDAELFLKRLESARDAAGLGKTADAYINFYKELNKRGNWMNPKEREVLLSHVKNGIKSTFRNSGPEGKQLAESFEKVNKGVQRAYQAEDVAQLLQKAHTAEGIDWKKTLKLFDKKSTWETLEAGLGKEQTQNLHKIAKAAAGATEISKKIGSKLESPAFDKLAKGGFIGLLGAAVYEHSPKLALGALALKGGAKASKEVASRLRTKMLLDPKFQNLTLNLLNAMKSQSPQALQRASLAIDKELQEEGIELEDLDLPSQK